MQFLYKSSRLLHNGPNTLLKCLSCKRIHVCTCAVVVTHTKTFSHFTTRMLDEYFDKCILASRVSKKIYKNLKYSYKF